MATKKIEGWANPNDAPDVILWHEDQHPKGLTKSATLVIHDGDPEQVFTASEVEASRKSDREIVQALVDACALVQKRRGPFHRDIEAERALRLAKSRLTITPSTEP